MADDLREPDEIDPAEFPDELSRDDGSVEIDESEDTFLPEEVEPADGELGVDGLEIDEAESGEIRQIFITTLPLYLEPVEQMVDQIIAEWPAPETVDALKGTLSSLGQAAAQVGIEEVVEQLGLFRRTISALQEDRGPPTEIDRERVLEGLRALMDVGGRSSGVDAGPGGPRGGTIFQALSGVEDLRDEVVHKLSAAGLTRVEQLSLARAEEVAAVTGLEARVVARLMRHVGTTAPARGHAWELERRGAPIQKLPLGPVALEKVLRQRSGAQEGAESSLAGARDRIQRLRTKVNERRERLRAVEQERDELNRELSSLSMRHAEREARAEGSRQRRSELLASSGEVAETVRRKEAQLVALRQRRQCLARQDVELCQDLQRLMERVRRVLARNEKRMRGRLSAPMRRGIDDDSGARPVVGSNKADR
jgi:hypothetical protein